MILIDNYTQLRLLYGVFVNLVVYIKAKIIESKNEHVLTCHVRMMNQAESELLANF